MEGLGTWVSGCIGEHGWGWRQGGCIGGREARGAGRRRSTCQLIDLFANNLVAYTIVDKRIYSDGFWLLEIQLVVI